MTLFQLSYTCKVDGENRTRVIRLEGEVMATLTHQQYDWSRNRTLRGKIWRLACAQRPSQVPEGSLGFRRVSELRQGRVYITPCQRPVGLSAPCFKGTGPTSLLVQRDHGRKEVYLHCILDYAIRKKDLQQKQSVVSSYGIRLG